MLSLKNITKDYVIGSETVHALKGVSMDFRDSEFVSVLGQSGCGKTTLLNIIGGLDKYSGGDLVINGRSTKKYKEKDWNTYRNHSIGFVFQSYNLIPHQSVLSNVELALTLSGVSKKERRRRATEALTKVGLADQLKKKPNQMSGGQMQRVAIARALVNDPDILLADEPTGALDSATSVQVMDILKEIAQEKLVIMVTHNPELAEQYSTRIIKLFDGEVVDDSDPFTVPEPEESTEKVKKAKKEKHKSMSFFTALGLSFNNLMTKKARTFMTSFAGSIGIIGIALILSISTGLDAYINKVEEDTLSSYPLTIESTTIDLSSFMESMMGKKADSKTHEDGKIYSNDVITDMMEAFSAGAAENDLAEFKKYLESGKSNINDLVSDIQYSYSTPLNIYKADTSDGVCQVNPGWVFEKLGMGGASEDTAGGQMGANMTNTNVWTELLDNSELLKEQYEVLAGKMPEGENEAVVIVDKNNEISDYTLYTLGIRDYSEVEEMLKAMYAGEEYEVESTSYTYDDILGLKFKLLTAPECYKKENGVWVDKSEDELFMIDKLSGAEEINIVGILRPCGDTAPSSGSGKVAYTSSLTKHLVEKVNQCEMVKEQKEKEDTDVFTGLKFKTDEDEKEFTYDDLNAYMATLPADKAAEMQGYMQQMKASGMSDEKILETFKTSIFKTSSATLEDNLKKMGVSDLDNPSKINIYPKDFESKEFITDIIETYNKSAGEAEQITYTDYIGIMMSSITTIISAISYILIAFVAISLVVSSIMIGIITYISVLERTKEIGILRAIGASKRDISRVFNAETLIVGFTAGVIGIGATLLLIIPINAIIQKLTEISATAFLPTEAAIVLVIISMVLTLVAGIVPSLAAAKKDPVIALRTE
ncbi:MAG: ABC transporter ATP-binding protein/permease [Clostridiales bacterium]|nr:ABC transporter ATP-binding protein/permease [Candidatus Equinaster intestinalis]